MSERSILDFEPCKNSRSSRRADDQPQHFIISVVKDLAQLIGRNQHASVFRHCQSFIADAHATRALQDKIKLLRPNVLVQRVRAFGRQSPQSRAQILAVGPLQIIRV